MRDHGTGDRMRDLAVPRTELDALAQSPVLFDALIGEDDDGELQAFGLVDGHQLHAIAAFFENRRLGGRGLGSLLQFFDEPSERNTSCRLVLPRELGHVQDIRQRLLPARSQNKAHVRTGLGNQAAQGLGYRAIVPPPMELLEHPDVATRLGKEARKTGQHYDIAAFVRKMERLYDLLHVSSRATRRAGILKADLGFLTE